jgi:GT2 family glycosyltransferase
MLSYHPDCFVRFPTNLGVAVGYNTAMFQATQELIVITGCDMLMPKNWLRTFKQYHEEIENTGIACMYSKPLLQVPERARPSIGFWERKRCNDLEYIPAMPIERRAFKKSLLEKIGYLREDFGLYGWEDVEWSHRAERVCKELNLLTYVIPDMKPKHLGTEGADPFDGQDSPEYHAFKLKEASCPKKQALMKWCRENNYPYYNPYEQ